MRRLQLIERALTTINDAAFQELCDNFLILKNSNYSAVSRTGSQIGKQKTIRGTPDSIFLLPNGKYLFVEYSTNITKGVSKIQNDIGKCLDTSKTGIPLDQIAEIIICINFKLKPNEIQNLKNIIAETQIILTTYTLDSLSLEINCNYPNLANEYLGLDLDSGQIVSIEQFIEEYSKATQGIATPLNIELLHRDKELEELKRTILINDFIILSGDPGVGKTKLALETIKRFIQENETYNAYCVANKSYDILPDLLQYFDINKNYILFIDDANRIGSFQQIIGYYKTARNGKLKIIITVRTYAFEEIYYLCTEFSPKKIVLPKLFDEQITDIIKSDPFNILNFAYQLQINKIADGNPRLAIMMALLAIEKQDIYALSDVSDLFEKYFSTFIRDKAEFKSEINLKCLGLIAFFYAIHFTDKEWLSQILTKFNLDYYEFMDVIEKLNKLELVEIQFEYVKISEQNLSTFFFYKSFIKDNLLSFETLLNYFFDNNSSRFRDCVVPANNSFGPQNVKDKLRPHLQNYFNSIKIDEDKAINFLSTFWFYFEHETLEFIYLKIEPMPIVEVISYDVEYETNAFAFKNTKFIELLGGFFIHPWEFLKKSLELSIEYIRRSPTQLPELIHKIKDNLIFNNEDARTKFIRQATLYEILINGFKNDDKLLSVIFYELSKTFLKYEFHNTESRSNDKLYWYHFLLPNLPPIQEFRKNIWKTLDTNFDKHSSESLEVLKNYFVPTPNVPKEIMEFDIPFIIEIIQKHLTDTSFEHCLYVQDQIRWCKKNSVNHEAFTNLSQTFRNAIYEIFLKVNRDRFRDKDSFDFSDYQEYEMLKDSEIRNSFIFYSISEFKEFYHAFSQIQAIKPDWQNLRSIEIIIDENFKTNPNIGYKILEYIVEKNNEFEFIPRELFRKLLNSFEINKNIWEIITSKVFLKQTEWKLSYFENLDDNFIDEFSTKNLIDTINQINNPVTLFFDRLSRYTKTQSNVLEKILEIITDKIEKEEIWVNLHSELFIRYIDLLDNNLSVIKKAYIQQTKLIDIFDYDGKGMLNILNKDKDFLFEYIYSILPVNNYSTFSSNQNLSIIWEIDNIEPILDKIITMLIEKYEYIGIVENIFNIFVRNLKDSYVNRVDNFILSFISTNHSSPDKMNIIFDILKNSRHQLLEEAMLLYLSKNQDINCFKRISWIGNYESSWGNESIGQRRVKKWNEILNLVKKANLEIKSVPIENYLNNMIDYELASDTWEKKRNFLKM